jgi:uroporphyrin-III C-methyltransferase
LTTYRRPVVHLVGAGPGDPELLTLKAIRAVRQATVLLVDDLVGAGVLRYARRSARIVHVGKRGGCASTPQAFIERLMAAEALRGERVVRLKGGDPFVFGRGGEEAEHLRALGLDVVVVSGITAGLAAATSIDVPLTHRDHAHGVIFVTGHARRDRPPSQAGDAGAAHGSPHWPTLAAAAAEGLTLVIYMGIATVESLQQGLAGALRDDTPVAIVQHASLPQQRHALCTLGELAATVQREALASPAVIVVGDVVRASLLLAGRAARPAPPLQPERARRAS